MREIGELDNYYGVFWVKKEKASYYWALGEYVEDGEDADYGSEDEWEWQEIPKYLYDALNKFEDKEEENKC